MAWYSADFGIMCAGLSDVGVTQLDATGAVTVQRAAPAVSYGNGLYGLDVAVDPNTVVLRWDTGGPSPSFASEEIAARVNVIQMNDAPVIGTGQAGNDWRGEGVPPQ